MPGHSGRITAAPVLFKIADLLGPAPAKPVRAAARGVCSVSRRELPPALRRLDAGAARIGPRDSGAPKILYPPDGATVAWDGRTAARSGRRNGTLRWLVDGRPLPPGAPRRAALLAARTAPALLS